MATQVQLRRGNTTQTNAFTGAVAEITIDTDKDTVVVHDGSTAGGFPLARESAVSANQIFAQAAFNTANASFQAANSAGSYANSSFAIANSTAAYSNTVNDTQNNSITSAFTTANSAGVYANGAFIAANTADNKATSAGVYANGAFIAANTADNKATSAGVYANGAFDKANTDVTNITISPSQAYGNATHIPIVTVSANGRINAISTVAVTATDPSAIAFAIALG